MNMKMKKITINNPETRSADVVAANLERLKALFPETFTEGSAGQAGKIDFEALKQLLGGVVNEREEKYGLNWHGKRQARQLALTPSTGTLRPCPEESTDWETTKNLMIEGDNLEVLKLLQKSYAGKVKLVYIDPPYNTGKDFVYPDNYRDNIQNYLELTGQVDGENRKLSSNTEASGRFHTDWLNMMYPRLKLARDLLRKNGVIFASINQIELANLQRIMDEIFGEENLFAILTRRAMHTVRNSSKDFNLHADYLLAYAKSKAWFGESQERYIRQHTDKSANYPYEDERGRYKLDPLHARNYYTPYQHTFSNGTIWSAPAGSYPRYAPETLKEMEKDNRIYFDDHGKPPKAKRYLAEVQKGIPPNSILAPCDVGFNSEGTKELRETLGRDKVFSQPKPIRLIEYLIKITDDPNAIVLDFFAGSGTTGHAVMTQNALDGGERRCFQIQLPEGLDLGVKEQKITAEYCDYIGKPRILTELTKERLRRAAEKIQEENPEYKGDLGFRVFKLDTSNIRTWEPDRDNLEGTLLDSVDHIKPDRSEEDILYELLLKLGLDLCVPIQTRTIAGKFVRAIGTGTLIACLDEKIAREEVEPLALGIAEWHKKLAPAGDTTVVFCDSAFTDDVAKVNLTAILQQHGLGNVRSL